MSNAIKITVHDDLYNVIKNYADAHDVSMASAARDICAIGAETLEGRSVRGKSNNWGGKRKGAGRPSLNENNTA